MNARSEANDVRTLEQTNPPESIAFRWNAASWFGSQIGATAYLLLGSLVLLAFDKKTSIIWLLAFAIANAIGLLLWRNKDRISPFAAYQTMFLVMLLVTLIALVSADRNGVLGKLGPGNGGQRSPYLAALVFPSLMIRFYYQERAARKAADYAKEADPQSQSEGSDR